MKIIIPLDENRKAISIVLGRAPLFMLHDTIENTTEILENPGANAEGGAGLKSAQFIVDSGANVLITVRCGENAAKVLKAAGIEIYKSSSTLADENIELYKAGQLELLQHFHAGYHGIK